MKHELKTWPWAFEEVWQGRKRFELRKDDRGFKTGDTLTLREWRPVQEEYTGRVVVATVSCVVEHQPSWGLADGFCIMSLDNCRKRIPGCRPG